MLIALTVIIFWVFFLNMFLAFKNYKSSDFELAMLNMFGIGVSLVTFIICVCKLVF